jgi:hypothetical protein
LKRSPFERADNSIKPCALLVVVMLVFTQGKRWLENRVVHLRIIREKKEWYSGKKIQITGGRVWNGLSPVRRKKGFLMMGFGI